MSVYKRRKPDLGIKWRITITANINLTAKNITRVANQKVKLFNKVCIVKYFI